MRQLDLFEQVLPVLVRSGVPIQLAPIDQVLIGTFPALTGANLDTAFLIFSKVWSQQYVLWLLPLIVLARPKWGAIIVWTIAEIGYLAAFYAELIGAGGTAVIPEGTFVLASVAGSGGQAALHAEHELAFVILEENERATSVGRRNTGFRRLLVRTENTPLSEAFTDLPNFG